MEQTSTTTIPFHNHTITITKATTPQGFSIENLLKFPQDFHAAYAVDMVIDFQDLFQNQIGTYNQDVFGAWDDKTISKEHVFIYEHHFDKAKKLVDNLTTLGKQLVARPSLYDDLSFAREYFDIVKEGYAFMNKHEETFTPPNAALIPVSVERAGLVCTRAAKGLSQEAVVPNEFRIIEKRIHMKKDPDTYLSVSVTFRKPKEEVKRLKNHAIEISDTVIGTGASHASCILAAMQHDAKPKAMGTRSLMATKQGIRFLQQFLDTQGVYTRFHTLGICDELTSNYYLTGKRVIGDAGHILRHFLPKEV